MRSGLWIGALVVAILSGVFWFDNIYRRDTPAEAVNLPTQDAANNLEEQLILRRPYLPPRPDPEIAVATEEPHFEERSVGEVIRVDDPSLLDESRPVMRVGEMLNAEDPYVALAYDPGPPEHVGERLLVDEALFVSHGDGTGPQYVGERITVEDYYQHRDAKPASVGEPILVE